MFVDKAGKVKGDDVVLVAVVSGWYDWRDRGWLGGRVKGLNSWLDAEIWRMKLRLKNEREILNVRRVLWREYILSNIG